MVVSLKATTFDKNHIVSVSLLTDGQKILNIWWWFIWKAQGIPYVYLTFFFVPIQGFKGHGHKKNVLSKCENFLTYCPRPEMKSWRDKVM
jgi:hypothetical protein